jgi:ketosteroid isomerase-like protein
MLNAVTSAEEQPGEAGLSEIELVRTGYERWNAGDISGLVELFSPEIEYCNSPEWPGQQVYRGADTVARFLTDEVRETINLTPVEITGIRVVDSEILVELQVRTQGALSGLDLSDGPLFHLAKVRDGQISRVRVFLTEDQAVEAAGGRAP